MEPENFSDWMEYAAKSIEFLAMTWLRVRSKEHARETDKNTRSTRYYYNHGPEAISMIPAGKRLAVTVQLEDDPNANIIYKWKIEGAK